MSSKRKKKETWTAEGRENEVRSRASMRSWVKPRDFHVTSSSAKKESEANGVVEAKQEAVVCEIVEWQREENDSENEHDGDEDDMLVEMREKEEEGGEESNGAEGMAVRMQRRE